LKLFIKYKATFFFPHMNVKLSHHYLCNSVSFSSLISNFSSHLPGRHSTTWITQPALSCVENFLYPQGWLQTLIFLIFSSWVARITDMSHRLLASNFSYTFNSYYRYICFLLFYCCVDTLLPFLHCKILILGREKSFLNSFFFFQKIFNLQH
jgi:hypothetical protein